MQHPRVRNSGWKWRGCSRKQPREGGRGEDTERSCGLCRESQLAHEDRTGREQSPLLPHSIRAPRCPHWSVHGLNLPGSQRARGPLLQPMAANPPGLRAERGDGAGEVSGQHACPAVPVSLLPLPLETLSSQVLTFHLSKMPSLAIDVKLLP